MATMLFAAAHAQTHSHEDKDWGIEPTSTYRLRQYHAPTPLTVPGGRTIKTIDLKTIVAEASRPIVIDVLDGKAHQTVPGAQWMPWAGKGPGIGVTPVPAMR